MPLRTTSAITEALFDDDDDLMMMTVVAVVVGTREKSKAC
jgi:hypothetical protein